VIAGVRLTHPERELWPGIAKRDLAEYWRDAASWALPGIAQRPLAILRCPDGIGGAHFFQKHDRGTLPPEFHEGEADGAPYLALEGVEGLVAAAQASAIELHAWGASEAEPLRPDRLVFDLDPGEGIGMAELVRAALDVRERLGRVGLAAFCRTSGGKGLHVVAPLHPEADWTSVRDFCRAFAERMAAEAPDRYVAVVRKSERAGRILVDWLRNGLGATAVASYSPRARPGAGVATPLAWREVAPRLDPAALNLRSVPVRLRRLERDPWEGFAGEAKPLPGGLP
jgi:bifunctional non-homologous end joining protein LigD